MTPAATGQPRPPEFRLVVEQRLPDGAVETIMDEHGEAFIAIVGTTTPHRRIQGGHSHGGPDHTVHDMAHILADTHLDTPR